MFSLLIRQVDTLDTSGIEAIVNVWLSVCKIAFGSIACQTGIFETLDIGFCLLYTSDAADE